ncbi:MULTISPECIES: ribose-5-phosphate isomerase RpiA [Priestia]|jgi:ribose 5-phosphate isomerase A|uniref:Ribose-5-phosphate isomerase A n=3 Tax=Priestia TaxID=2800373 RepID=D5DXX7_PRIM1|nr:MULTISPECIES: ribose-5-phosphate isomerase RpiA [Priestia]AVX07158.1 ribose-5-phosphate isomerase RpiA [Bacillus sp. Y-01]KOP73346.1 ribose 5-phosphate isomerase [Bacillus sp. FJAT-21351]KQU26930.1 ribose 5-phosphate isomerase [Bacillus sp. Leaf75]KRF52976.1 ribose 5-phosphate isomerase [Bacillus sp. Soil531]MBZ5479430.1 ribose-5-phosphate isomerase RpiA [Bacillus sp. T_4]MCF6794901.1 ribose-5-phosphate isomerase RpiA [Bacillus sp. ET1]MDH6656054.1 ribose 5-phosphate isomerase A [Bacillus
MIEKQAVGEKAAQFVEDGMIVGLGTGSTAYYTIVKLGERVKNGLNIKAVPTSQKTEELARKLGIPIVTLADVEYIDIAIDGADEVDSELSLIKGGGGALLREKMIAYAAKRFIVIADSKKIVKTLGAFPLPVEVIRFGWEMTAKHIRSAGCVPQLRLLDDHTPFITDNGNYILDCHFSEIENPAELEKQLIRIPGVVESGLFVGMTEEVITVQNQDVHIIKK